MKSKIKKIKIIDLNTKEDDIVFIKSFKVENNLLIIVHDDDSFETIINLNNIYKYIIEYN